METPSKAIGSEPVSDKHILIVEDDAVTRTLLREVLERAGFSVSTAGDGPDALTLIQRQGLPHLMVVDLGLPTMHGFEVCRRVKRMGDVPIIILTGEASLESVLEGIDNYAEDYIRKPFHLDEVVARIRRVLSRLPEGLNNVPVQIIDDYLSVDFANNRLIVEDRNILLTPTESKLLYLLLTHQGKVVRATTLMARVWQDDGNEDTLRVHMSRLRRKMHNRKHPRSYIHTERGVGYFFSIEDIKDDGNETEEDSDE